MLNAVVAYAKTRDTITELNKIKQSEITKALDEIEVLITNAIKRGEFAVTVYSIDGLSQHTFGKLSGILITVLKQHGYEARILVAKSAIIIGWENV